MEDLIKVTITLAFKMQVISLLVAIVYMYKGKDEQVEFFWKVFVVVSIFSLSAGISGLILLSFIDIQ